MSYRRSSDTVESASCGATIYLRHVTNRCILPAWTKKKTLHQRLFRQRTRAPFRSGTALAEVLGRNTTSGSLSPEELALTKADSISILSVTGKLEAVVDVRLGGKLQPFVALIKDFKLSRTLRSEAQALGVQLDLVRTVELLQKALGRAIWRDWPMLYDVPASGQIFGSIALDAGTEGILYESVTTGKQCLAVFPQNFVNSSAFVELDDPVPSDEVPRRVDSTNFKQFV